VLDPFQDILLCYWCTWTSRS